MRPDDPERCPSRGNAYHTYRFNNSYWTCEHGCGKVMQYDDFHKKWDIISEPKR